MGWLMNLECEYDGYFSKDRNGTGPETRTSSIPAQTAERRKCSLQTQQNKHSFLLSLGPNQSLQLTQFFRFSDHEDQIVAIICTDLDEVESHAFMAVQNNPLPSSLHNQNLVRPTLIH